MIPIIIVVIMVIGLMLLLYFLDDKCEVCEKPMMAGMRVGKVKNGKTIDTYDVCFNCNHLSFDEIKQKVENERRN